jgi:hypothetical protein
MPLSFAELKPSDPYYEGWRTFARRDMAFLIAWAIWLPVAFSLGLMNAISRMSPLAALVPFMLFAVLLFYSATARCPRCGGWFKFASLNLFRKTCRKCRLPIWSPIDPSKLQTDDPS